MKKIITSILIVLTYTIVIGLFTSCSDDDNGLELRVTAITNYTLDDHSVIHEAKVGQTIRIVGQQLSTLKAVYINGQIVNGINKCYLTDYQLLMKIPPSIKTEDEMDDLTYLNSIRFVGEYNECIYSIRIYK